MSLPADLVDSIFARLSVRYGAAFIGQWPDADPAALKADWGRALAGFAQQPEAIAYALDNLPDTPINVGQFRAIARRTPPKVLMRLPEPPADPARLRAELAKLAALTARKRDSTGRDEKAWAKRLQEIGRAHV